MKKLLLATAATALSVGMATAEDVKIGILIGSLISGLAGYAVLRFAKREAPRRVSSAR